MGRTRAHNGLIDLGIKRHFFRIKSGLLDADEGEEPKPFFFWMCNGCNWESGEEFDTPSACKDDLADHIEMNPETHLEALEKWMAGRF